MEASTTDVTCLEAATCDGPSAKARAGVTPPAAKAETPDGDCLAGNIANGAEGCAPGRPSLSDAAVTAYVGVNGLDSGQDRSAETQDQRAAQQSDSGASLFGASTEAALLVGALGLGASGAAAWFGFRRIATFLLAPLASRLKRSELLDNDTRRGIYEEIKEDPGVNLRAIADRLDLAWGTLLHHLRKLEDNHMITSKRYGKYRRFFLNGSTYTKEEQARLAALSTPSTARVAEYILENPGANQSEIGDAIGVTPSTILFHVRRLKDVDLVEEEREGRYVHYYPNIQDHEAERMAAPA